MNKKQIEQEWKKLTFETIYNKPKLNSPYPSDIVKRREYLLFAEVYLGKTLEDRSRKDRYYKQFETEIYNKTMETYYNCGKSS